MDKSASTKNGSFDETINMYKYAMHESSFDEAEEPSNPLYFKRRTSCNDADCKPKIEIKKESNVILDSVSAATEKVKEVASKAKDAVFK
uniref:Uncharacterized protein n=1 Tax=Rhabditophanes sp. KR3021 TaxID=114890 RepID=A0AC35TG31_9BILA